MFFPNNYLLVSGVGVDTSQLVSFDKALFSAGVVNYNLVKVSSILPPNCLPVNIITAKEGSIIFAAYSARSQEKHCIISSAIGVGIPKDPSNVGVIMEYSCDDSDKKKKKKVRSMVIDSMTLRGIELAEIKTTSIEKMGNESVFTTVISALVMW
jgi:arginine decarboxylase